MRTYWGELRCPVASQLTCLQANCGATATCLIFFLGGENIFEQNCVLDQIFVSHTEKRHSWPISRQMV